ncbi:uncharacterized protein LOC111396702 [Olea europaea var. sylvestris]|uniref:uncharacterized protein LOC111396702 n=1 Tax=Olea europaea var. sylvestris TaxID=158386 RepID=UPI000C1D5E89|nr:uncharacterized protein LOC111396702 [Olea europaea var. sylvestris]
MEGMQMGMEKVQMELQRVQNIEKNMAIISEQFTFMRTRWEEAERERKGKGQAGAKDSEYTGQSEVSPDMGMNGRERGYATGGSWKTEIKGRRLEMPVFMGNNPDEWIFKAERYFTVNHLTELENLETAGLCFEEGALSWYQWEQKRRGVRSWEELKGLLRARVRSTLEGTTEERFLALRQEGSVMNYRHSFETLATPICDVSEAILEGHFINELSPEIKAEVRMLQPKGLEQIMELAQRIEEKNKAPQAYATGSGPLRSKLNPNPNGYPLSSRNQSNTL